MIFGVSCVGEDIETLNADPTRQTCGLGFKNKEYICRLTPKNRVLVLFEDVQVPMSTKFVFCTLDAETAGSSEESLTIDTLSGPRRQ